MSKGGGFLTAKAISNRIKSIGLQKLRWYCQMCQKQCRDENGFKCHIASETHLRQMRIFAENSHTYMDQFSSDFEKGYLDVLNHRHGTKRVQANRVYQEYIADKHHIHMNSTMWTGLSEFVKYLGREGKCVVDETEKGWFVTYIDRDPKLLAKQAAAEQRQKHELDEDQRTQRAIEQQIVAARLKEQEGAGDASAAVDDEGNGVEASVSTELVRDESSAKIGITLKVGETKKRPLASLAFDPSGSRQSSDEPKAKRAFGDNGATSIPNSSSSSSSSSSAANQQQPKKPPAAPLTAIEQLMREQEQRKQQQLQQEEQKEKKDYWLHPGIVVKVLSKKLAGGKFYKSKAVVLKVLDKYVGEIRIDDCGTVVRIDQEELETVIPKEGRTVLIVNGAGRGKLASVERINESSYNCDIKLLEGDRREIVGVEYENISKIADT